MSPALQIFKFVLSVLTGLSGTVINSLVLTLLFLQWKHSSNSVVCDQIQMSIVLMNVLLQLCLTVDGVLNSLQTSLNLGETIFLITFSLQFTMFYAGAWNAAWLSAYYYVRLVNFSHPYFLRLKALFLSSVPQLIVGSALGSAVINLPFIWITELSLIQNRTHYTQSIYDVQIDFSYTIFNAVFGFFLPFTLTCVLISQCVTSLLRHVRRINLSECSLTSSQLQGHIRAARTMIMRVVLNLTFYLLAMIAFLTSFQIHAVYIWCVWIATLMYPTVQSLILIHGNPKMKSKIRKHCGFN